MIYVTGDTHGDLSRFKSAEAKKLRAGDTLIVCGDFGFDLTPAQGRPTRAQKDLAWLTKRPYDILFLSGAHDDEAYLQSLPEEEWNGGLTHKIAPNIRHLQSGCLFLMEEDYYLTVGGGAGEEEALLGEVCGYNDPDLPRRVKEALAPRRNVTDYILSHEVPSTIRSCLTGNGAPHLDAVTPVLDWVMQECLYKKWFSGALHMDRHIPPAYYSLYQKIIPVRK